MRNYSTIASFIIPCSQDQAKEALKAFEHIDDGLSAFAAGVVKKSPDELSSPLERIIQSCYRNHPDQDIDDQYIDDEEIDDEECEELFWDFDADLHDEGIWITPKDTIHTEHAAVFTQAVLQAYDLPHLVEIAASHYCDSYELDAFGGHGYVVTKDMMRWADLHDFFAVERMAHDNNEAYYLCSTTENHGGKEYRNDFLVCCSKGTAPESLVDDIANIKFTATEITPTDFRVMKQYLTVLQPGN